ncbi:unnamed protein product [Vitrella brassicaformis CCMP3155]|uniref:Uncharacterized protein n=3 Tax=Vitrella brassicaformis TaxID=1169539 RepID=A0A0G4EGN8_VITBC|nr:unnamed protein product [Vitrella brassicaformis CCMP3155]|eukprot:CEL95614.1 unnamed protein product [Vitrella brassicaformis CCMP3155]
MINTLWENQRQMEKLKSKLDRIERQRAETMMLRSQPQPPPPFVWPSPYGYPHVPPPPPAQSHQMEKLLEGIDKRQGDIQSMLFALALNHHRTSDDHGRRSEGEAPPPARKHEPRSSQLQTESRSPDQPRKRSVSIKEPVETDEAEEEEAEGSSNSAESSADDHDDGPDDPAEDPSRWLKFDDEDKRKKRKEKREKKKQPKDEQHEEHTEEMDKEEDTHGDREGDEGEKSVEDAEKPASTEPLEAKRKRSALSRFRVAGLAAFYPYVLKKDVIESNQWVREKALESFSSQLHLYIEICKTWILRQIKPCLLTILSDTKRKYDPASLAKEPEELRWGITGRLLTFRRPPSIQPQHSGRGDASPAGASPVPDIVVNGQPPAKAPAELFPSKQASNAPLTPRRQLELRVEVLLQLLEELLQQPPPPPLLKFFCQLTASRVHVPDDYLMPWEAQHFDKDIHGALIVRPVVVPSEEDKERDDFFPADDEETVSFGGEVLIAGFVGVRVLLQRILTGVSPGSNKQAAINLKAFTTVVHRLMAMRYGRRTEGQSSTSLFGEMPCLMPTDESKDKGPLLFSDTEMASFYQHSHHWLETQTTRLQTFFTQCPSELI